MKVLFLDFDGVLNSEQSAKYWYAKGKRGLIDDACPIAAANLRMILENIPDLKIVISSTWRCKGLNYCQDCLIRWDIMTEPDRERVIGITPSSRDVAYGPRGAEIKLWLEHHPEVEKFVIVDDDSDMWPLNMYLVQTNWREGLMIRKAWQIIDRFS